MRIEVFSPKSGEIRFKVFKNNKFLLNFYSTNNVSSAKRELMKKLHYEYKIPLDKFLNSKWVERAVL